MPGQLFVTGSPHARVLDIGMLLNEHPQVLLGIERFTGVSRMADPFLLAPDRLVEPLSVETKVRGELLYSRLRERVAGGQLALVGDVDTGYVRSLDMLETRLGQIRIVVVVGEPAPADTDEWRATLRLARDSEQRWFPARVFVLPFAAFAGGNGSWLRALLAFLELEPTARLESEYARLCAGRAAGQSGSDPSADSADAEIVAWLQRRTAAQLKQHAPAPPPVTITQEADPLTSEELDYRAREREQLLSERQAGSAWPDQRQALEARYIEQARETVGRGTRVRRALMTGAGDLPDPSFRVNLIGPGGDPGMVGRSDALEQLARYLGRLCTVRLFSVEPPRRTLPGVELRLGAVASAAPLDDCDVVIYPADVPDAARLLDGVPALMRLDGFEAPGDDRVSSNLESAREVLASSDWLCRMARQCGKRTIHLPLGLDRTMFAQGPPSDQRQLHVTAISQAPPWMGHAELSEAMVRLREARPEVEVTFFGGMPADGATKFYRHPPIGLVAQVLRMSAVHVVSAHEEGFGYIGAGALACGAALVTTDTHGSREYAIDGYTALVAPVGEPEALADRVLELLEDVTLRARLATEGASYVRSLMRPWPDVARCLAVLLTERA